MEKTSTYALYLFLGIYADSQARHSSACVH